MELIIFNLLFITVGLLIAMSYTKFKAEENLELIASNTDTITLMGGLINSLRADLDSSEKHIAHAISEIQILKGGMIENDELIDDLYEQGKKVSATVERLDQPKRKPARVVNKLKKTQATSVKIKSPKDMVFNMSNKQKLSRRSK